jgi:hypothetical protein
MKEKVPEVQKVYLYSSVQAPLSLFKQLLAEVPDIRRGHFDSQQHVHGL